MRSREQVWFKWAPVLYSRGESDLFFLFIEGHLINGIRTRDVLFRDNLTQEDYNIQLDTYGLGLFMGWNHMIIIPIGWGELAGDYYGLHTAAGVALSTQLGLYTNGTRLLLVTGIGFGFFGMAGVSHIKITPAEN